jgi:hypothetical protein
MVPDGLRRRCTLRESVLFSRCTYLQASEEGFSFACLTGCEGEHEECLLWRKNFFRMRHVRGLR